MINKIIFNNRFKVVKGYGNRTIFNKIKKDESNELIIIIVDRMIDNTFTERTYKSIQNILRMHTNIFLPIYGSTERSFITYEGLNRFVPKSGTAEDKLKKIILSNSESCGVIEISSISDPLFWKFYNDNVKADKTGNKFSEYIYNSLLAKYTNNTYAQINKNKIGPCWLFDCCNVANKTCQIKKELLELQKIKDIVSKSEFGYTISEIFEYISIYLNRTYKYNRYDNKWKNIIINKGMSNLDICIRTASIPKWNYENIYRRIA